MRKSIRIALVGDYNADVPAHKAIPAALALAGNALDCDVQGHWIGTAEIAGSIDAKLAGWAGIWLVPASPYDDEAAALETVRFAREGGVPFLGTCGGYQHALIEYFRSEIGIMGADSLENDPTVTDPVIAPLACALIEVMGDVHFLPGSRMAALHGCPVVQEGYRCSFGINADYEARLAGSGLVICARDGAGDPRGFELEGHPFFFGTGYQPERAALAGRNHPLVNAFVQATMRRLEMTVAA
ncbi:CTP synthase C-terminal region-related (seleno)protein [Aestuariispira insulae]|uniref:Glutamine amidotransferase class I n=1 Tax=Aestuariispira insulae TaxID=1461337 RepID=A0A3D9HWJ5_9PROT|nr:hypothetical protein [Aestuariispira insulae]RED53780.1 glutamine amidotransferase class I [Aestuariispira insulae]